MNRDNPTCCRCGATIDENCEFNRSLPEDSPDRKSQSGMFFPDDTFACSDCYTDEEEYENYKVCHFLCYGHNPYDVNEYGECACDNKEVQIVDKGTNTMEEEKRKKCSIHKYHKVTFAGMKVFACSKPLCSHYMPKHMEMLLIGKASYCWSCDGVMVMDEVALDLDKPICVSCRLKKIELPDNILNVVN